MRIFTLLFSLLFVNLLAADYSSRILFIGNSYLYYNDSLHNHVKRLLEEKYPNIEPEIKSATIGGSRLSDHPFSHLINHENHRLDMPFNYVVMQGGSYEVINQENQTHFWHTVKKNAELAQANDIETALYMTHAYLPIDERYEPNLIEKIKATYYQAAKLSNSKVVPVGIAYELAYEKDPKIKLHHPDGTHPSMLGTYLGACVVFATLTDSNPVGLNYNYLDKVSDKDRIFLQQIAWAAYLENKKIIQEAD